MYTLHLHISTELSAFPVLTFYDLEGKGKAKRRFV